MPARLRAPAIAAVVSLLLVGGPARGLADGPGPRVPTVGSASLGGARPAAVRAATVQAAAVQPGAAGVVPGEDAPPPGPALPVFRLASPRQHLAPLDTRRTAVAGRVRLRIGDWPRTFDFYLPRSPVRGPLPVIVRLRGLSQDGPDSAMDFQRDAARRHYAVLAPSGYASSWNAGSCCGYAHRHGIDDVGAIVTMLGELGRAYPLDLSRVYAAGFSNGGMMAYRLACARPGLLAGLAVVSGAAVAPCAPSHPLPALVVHGTADLTVPYAGSPWSALLRSGFPPVSAMVAALDRVNAPAGRPTLLVTIPGGGHVWPTAASGYDATRAVEDFFLGPEPAPAAPAGGLLPGR